MLGTRAIWRDGWKADAIHAGAPVGLEPLRRGQVGALPRRGGPLRVPRPGRRAPRAAQGADRPLARRRPASTSACRSRTATAIEVLDDTAAADEPAAGPLHLLPATRSRCPRRSPSTCAAARSRSPPRSTSTRTREGVLFAHGHQLRRPRPVHQGRQAQVRLQLPRRERADDHLRRGRADRQVRARRRVHQGEVARSHRRCRTSAGTLTLYIDDKKVGELKDVMTQLGKFNLCGEGLNIGRDGGAPGHRRLPGQPAVGVHRRHDQAGRRGRER